MTDVVYYITAKVKENKIYLFMLHHNYGGWTFETAFGYKETYGYIVGKFPEDFFNNLCKSMYFIEANKEIYKNKDKKYLEFPTEIEFYKGKRYIDEFKKVEKNF